MTACHTMEAIELMLVLAATPSCSIVSDLENVVLLAPNRFKLLLINIIK